MAALLGFIAAVTVIAAGIALADFIRWISDEWGPWWATAFVAALSAAGVVSLAVFG